MSQMNICRLCLKPPAIQFSVLGNNITQMLESLIHQPLNPHDEITTFICLKCLLSVKLAFTIQQKIKKSEEKLLKLVKKINRNCDFELNDLVNLCEEKCVICGFCDKNISINDHIIGHFNEEQVCGICRQSFSNIQLMREHLMDHSEKVIHECSKCEAKFLYKSLFDKHISLVCFPEIAKYHQKFDDPLSDIKTLQPVLVEKNKKRAKTCDVCRATFKYKKNLINHMFAAHNQLKYKCVHCGSKFKEKSALVVHQNEEHLEHMHRCSTCGKCFYKLKHLQKHVNIKHLKLMPHICGFCKKSYSSRSALKIHERIHTNETPYMCEVCGKGFRQNVCLRRHRKRKHGILEETTCECSVCGRGFVSDMALRSHMRMLH